MIKKQSGNELRKKRAIRTRQKVAGTVEVPRLVVNKSLKQLYVQLIDDSIGHTVLAASTLSKEYQAKHKKEKSHTNLAAAKNLGTFVAAQIKEKKIESIRFDRRGFKYHGSVKALADAIREGGIKF